MSDPLKVLADIVMHELELTDKQVLLENQRYTVPTAGLMVIIAAVSGKPIGNNNFGEPQEEPETGMNEVQEVAMNDLVQIDLMSFDAAARLARAPVIAALTSMYAQRKMGEELIQIGRIPPSGFLNVSALETTAMLNRYTITVNVKYLFRKVKEAEYYDQFPGPEVQANV